MYTGLYKYIYIVITCTLPPPSADFSISPAAVVVGVYERQVRRVSVVNLDDIVINVLCHIFVRRAQGGNPDGLGQPFTSALHIIYSLYIYHILYCMHKQSPGSNDTVFFSYYINLTGTCSI